MAKTRILALDGGGIRGVVSIVLLERLSAVPALAGWLARAQVLAGASTGALIALGLARGLSLATLRSLYETRGRAIFDDSFLDDLIDVGKIVGADYDSRRLQRELRAAFGETTTLGELGRRVVVPTFDLDNREDLEREVAAGRLAAADLEAHRTWKPKVFHNFPGADSDRDALAWRVGTAATAAPTFFPTFDGYIDGGVYANNPSLIAVVQTQDQRNAEPRPRLDELVVLSVGTGASLSYVRGQRLDWGYAQWARPLVEVMLEGVSGIADYQCGKLLGGRYHRLAPVFPPGVRMPLDAVARVPEMIAFAEAVDLTAATEFLEREWT